MNPTSLCAIVVTYQPGPEVAANLAALRPQVDVLVVVDNASSPETLAALRDTLITLQIHLIANTENLGIATALNQGLRWAHGQGAVFSILFDQDSTVTPGFIATMLACFQQHPLGTQLALLVPRYVDQRDGAVLRPFLAKDGTLAAAMTSGTLLLTALPARVGPFADDYFIDSVDYEFSLRVRSAGLKIAQCVQAVLLHSPGTPTLHPHLFGQGHFQAANYSPLRRYYQERNKLLMLRRHGRRHLLFCLGQVYISFKELTKILFFEPAEGRGHKLRFFFRGWRDGLSGRAGKLDARTGRLDPANRTLPL
jgi:rhamnosyltransferase